MEIDVRRWHQWLRSKGLLEYRSLKGLPGARGAYPSASTAVGLIAGLGGHSSCATEVTPSLALPSRLCSFGGGHLKEAIPVGRGQGAASS